MIHLQLNGKPCKAGQVYPDHYESTFTLTIRSMRHVGKDDLLDLLQTKYEVTKIEEKGTVVFCR